MYYSNVCSWSYTPLTKLLSLQPYHIIQRCNISDPFNIILTHLATTTQHSFTFSMFRMISHLLLPQFLSEHSKSYFPNLLFLLVNSKLWQMVLESFQYCIPTIWRFDNVCKTVFHHNRRVQITIELMFRHYY